MSNGNGLIQRYLQAVGFWLSRSQKEDILAELQADLESQVEEREAELGRTLSDPEIAEILRRRGQPAVVAAGYLPQRSLIGPELYPIYAWVIRIPVGISIAVWIFIAVVSALTHGRAFSEVSHGLPTLFRTVLLQVAIVTAIFALLERLGVSRSGFQLSGQSGTWDPMKLPALRPPQATRRRRRALTDAVFHGIGLMWLLALPRFPFLILGPAALVLHPAPVWHAVYPFLIGASLLGMAEAALVLARPDLPWLAPVAAFFTRAWSVGIVVYVARATVFVLTSDAHVANFAALMNLLIRIGVAGAGVGMAIAMAVYAWQAVRAFSEDPGHGPDPSMSARRI